MEFTLTFIRLILVLLQVTAPVILLLLGGIVVLGQLAGRVEKWSPGSTLYWSFITATTVGYGDIRPASRSARVLAVIIALFGLMLFGVLVAIAVQATTEAARIHADLESFRAITGSDG